MSTGTMYICIKQFNARLGDELSLKVGDKLELLADDSEYNDGWYMGKNIITGKVGLYPKLFTQLVQDNKAPSLLRSRSRKVGANINQKEKDTLPQTHSKTGQVHGQTSLGQSYSAGESDKVGKTMNDIDRALEELQIDQFGESPNQSYDMSNGDDSLPLNTSKLSLSTPFTSQLSVNPGPEPLHLRSTSMQSLTEDLNPLKAHEWTPQQVSSYFAIVLGFDMELAGKFARHKITGDILFQLDLAHLKELEIDSFGTRFEVHKEIEKLRAISSRNAKHKSLSRSASFKEKPKEPTRDFSESTISEVPEHAERSQRDQMDQRDQMELRGRMDQRDQRTRDQRDRRDYAHKRYSVIVDDRKLMPSATITNLPYKTHHRKRSQSVDDVSEKRGSTLLSPSELLFASPRKAPEPPASGKPVDSPVNRSFKFGGSPDPQARPPSRPASSVYEPLMVSHTRGASSVLGHLAPQHRRNSSVISGYTSTQTSMNGTHTANNTMHTPASNGTHVHTQSSNNALMHTPAATPSWNPQSAQSNSTTTPTTASGVSNRHSGFFLFLSGNAEKKKAADDSDDDENSDNIGGAPYGKLISPVKVKRENARENELITPKQRKPADDTIDIDSSVQSPKKLKSVSYRTERPVKDEKRATSDSTGVSGGGGTVARLKTLRTTSTQNFRNLTLSKKLKTSAFQEGIREIQPEEAVKTANYSGWMSKRSGNTLSWRSRYFTLHGTRLSYFTSMKDKKEKGLIDITAHKVVPINPDSESGGSNDKYVALYALSTGYGRYCFKILPPAPGFKKGLTFTQPKTHFFAVDSAEEMRGWLKALMVATIDIDDTVPVVSSCSTPTVSLSKAQELLAKAREETRLKDEELRAKGFLRDGANGLELDTDYGQYINDLNTDVQTSLDLNTSPNIDSVDETTVNSIPPKGPAGAPPKLSVDTTFDGTKVKAPSTPLISQSPHQAGFASPYLLASGLLSPKSGQSANSPGTPNLRGVGTDYFQDGDTEEDKSFQNTTSRAPSGSRRKNAEKMLAYTSDGLGNHTFVIKSKK